MRHNRDVQPRQMCTGAISFALTLLTMLADGMVITSHDELVRRCKALGLSLAEVTRRTGDGDRKSIAESSLSRWASGRHEPRLKTLKRLTEVIEAAEAEAQLSQAG